MINVVIKKDSKYGVLYDTPKNIRYVLLYGGRATGRSFQASRSDVINLATKPYYRGFLMRNVLDTVRDSIYQDSIDRIGELELSIPYTESSLLIKYGDNQLKGRGFRKSSGSDTAKNKSLAGVNVVTVEEAEETDVDDFNQLDLSMRTVKGQVVIKLLFNPPVKGHWILKEWFNLIPATKENAHKYFNKCWFEDVEDKFLDGYFLLVPRSDRTDTHFIFGTYHENIANLDSNLVAKMVRFKETNIDYYLHKVCGLVPSGKTGRVFKNFSLISKQDFEALPYPSRYGLDFGYNHPAAATDVKVHNGKIYVREILYETGLTNRDLYDRLKWINQKIIADNAEPKSIEELDRLGLHIEASKKGADSVTNGIQKINQFELVICEDSENILLETENYCYKLDKNKEPTDTPKDEWNHGWDTVRYAIEDIDNPVINLDATFVLI